MATIAYTGQSFFRSIRAINGYAFIAPLFRSGIASTNGQRALAQALWAKAYDLSSYYLPRHKWRGNKQ